MSDQGLRQVILDAVPPLTAPLDRIGTIGRRVRRQRLRYVGMSAAAGVTLLALAAATVTLLPGNGSAGNLTAGAASTRSAVSTPSSPPVTAPTATPRTQEATRLTEELKQLMAGALPGANFLPDSTFCEQLCDDAIGQPLMFTDHGDHFTAGAMVKDSAGTGSVQILVGRKDSVFGSSRACSTDPTPKDIQFTCEVRPGSHGAIIIVSTTTRGTWIAYQVQYIRTDGNSVCMRVSNAPNVSDAAQRPTPPLTKNQLVTLAATPALATTLS